MRAPCVVVALAVAACGSAGSGVDAVGTDQDSGSALFDGASATGQDDHLDAGATDALSTETGDARQDGTVDPCGTPSSNLLSLEDAPLSLVVDGDYAVWGTSSMQTDGTYLRSVRRGATDGSQATTIHQTRRELAAVTVANGNVYWTESDEGGGSAVLLEWASSSGNVRPVHTFDGTYGALDPFALGADEARAFTVFRKDVGPGLRSTYAIWAAPFSGAKPELVASHPLDFRLVSRGLSLDREDIFVGFLSGFLFRAERSERDAAAALLVDAVEGVDAWDVRKDDIVFAQNGAFLTVARDGGASTALPFIANAYRTVLARRDWIVWGSRDASGGEDIRIRRNDGLVCVLAKTDVKSVYSMGTDGRNVYWTNTATRAAGGAIGRAALPLWATP